jgi:hypothetical protein
MSVEEGTNTAVPPQQEPELPDEVNINELSIESNSETETSTEAVAKAAKATNATPEAAVPAGIASASGAEIAASSEQEEADAEASDEGIFLGDRFTINSKPYGEITGRIYYLNPESMIRIMPDGVSNRVYDFPLIDGDWAPELEIAEEDQVVRVEAGPRPPVGFAELNGLSVGQRLITFNENGQRGPSYEITAVNLNEDRIIVKDETDASLNIDFAKEGGIPTDLPFRVLQISQPSAEAAEKPKTPQEIAAETREIELAQTPGAAAAASLGEEDIEFDVLGEYELPKVTFVRQIAATERVYPELMQKSELFADLVNLLDAPSQRNPTILKFIRSQVEMLSSLKNSIIKRGRDGIPDGETRISIQTLAEILKSETVPIARPVLDTKSVIYTFFPTEATQTENISIEATEDEVNASKAFLENLGNLPKGEAGVGIPRFAQALELYFSKYPLANEFPGGNYSFHNDAEFFRQDFPDSNGVQGLDKIPLGTSKDEKENPELQDPNGHITQIPFSLRRAHGPTYRPSSSNPHGGTDIAIRSSKANVKGYVLFPYKAALQGAIGSTRTGKFWDTFSRSLGTKTFMEEILEKYGGVVTDEKDASKILGIEGTDAEIVSIPFSDYLNLVLQNLAPRGPGDLTTLKSDLGITDFEPTPEQADVVQGRVKEVLASIREKINQQRTALAEMKITPGMAPILDGDYSIRLRDLLAGHPQLDGLLKELSQRTPGYKGIDVATTAYLLRYAQDYFLAVLGGDKTAIKREYIRFARDILTQTLRDAIKLNALQAIQGTAPEINPCSHVKDITIIRKVQDDTERMKLFMKFLGKYQGGREENWLTCSQCKKHLVCHHELLQVQQFLYPNEKDAIQKEIISNYAGGLEGTHYICRNCGLPIAELDFERGMEFDDNGHPLGGRGEVIDVDAAEEEKIRLLVGAPVVSEQDLTFETDVKTEIYSIAKVICNHIGLSLSGEAYMKIVDRAAAEASVIISAKAYASLPKEQRRATYAEYLAYVKIAMVGSLILLTVQTAIPDLVVKFYVQGCNPGFGGFPLVADASPTDGTQSVGLNYLACAITGIFQQTQPWLSGYQKISSDDKRKALIMKYLVAYTQRFVGDVATQGALDTKRNYLRETFGAAAEKGRPSERLPPNFLPPIEREKEASANAANGPTVAEGARNNKQGDVWKSAAWIRAANRAAKGSAVIIQGSPFAETACCFGPLGAPGKYLIDAELPKLPERYVIKPGYAYQSILYTPMIPRPLALFNASPSLDIAYRVFLTLCYKGPRVGLPHEIGYDHICDWCGLKFPTEYLYPDIPREISATMSDAQKRKVREENEETATRIIQEVRSSLEAQGVQITSQTFQALLDASHARTIFTPYRPSRPQEPITILDSLVSIDPQPVQGFSDALKAAMENLTKIGDTSAGVEVARALAPLRDSVRPAEDEVQKRIGPSRMRLLNDILKEPVETVFEILRAYFIIPVERLLNNYDLASAVKVPSWYKLSSVHSDEISGILTNHSQYLMQFNLYPEENPESLYKAQLKLQQYSAQVEALMPLASEMRASRLGFAKNLTPFQVNNLLRSLLRVFLFGPLGELLDPDLLPEVDEEEISVDPGTSDSFVVRFVNALVVGYEKERLSYNPSVVRQKLDEAREMEAQRFISRMDTLTDEMRQAELLKKKFGLGEWAKGGSKAIWSYDPEYWEENRAAIQTDYERAAAAGPDGIPDLPAPVVDMYGFAVEAGGEEGYDVNPHPENDDD